MTKIIKKILIALLTFSLVLGNVTYYETREVKAAITTGLTLAEVLALILGGAATTGIIANGGTLTKEDFDIMWERHLYTVAAEKELKYANGLNEQLEVIRSHPDVYRDYAWDKWQNEREENPDAPLGGIAGNPSLRDVWAESWDAAPENFELWQKLMQQNAPDPEDPNQGKNGALALKLFGAGVLMCVTSMTGGIGVENDMWTWEEFFTKPPLEPNLIIDPDTGEVFLYYADGKSIRYGKPSDYENLFCDGYDFEANMKHKGQGKYSGYDYMFDFSGIGVFITYGEQTGFNFKKISGDSAFTTSFPCITYKDGAPSGSSNGSGWSNYWGKSFTATCPIIPVENEAEFVRGEYDIKDALNYFDEEKLPSEEDTQKIKNDIVNFNQAIQDAKEHGQEMPFENIHEAYQQYIQDAYDEMTEEVTQETTPEEVKDKIKDKIHKDMEQVAPIVAPSLFDTPVDPVDPIDPVDPPVPPPSGGGTLGGVLATAFPFCIPFDLIYLIKALKAEPEAPKWVIPVEFERLGIKEEIVIDFSTFEPVAEVCRVCFTILFILALIMVTRKLIKG